ncbi:hypothetical protein WAB17_06925 [Parerythrobacter aurantius]|uniref:hypothetical protein n=1 Tax=Parerythrobacter aurantius TaxID=3127706 RepID=UPI003248BC38
MHRALAAGFALLATLAGSAILLPPALQATDPSAAPLPAGAQAVLASARAALRSPAGDAKQVAAARARAALRVMPLGQQALGIVIESGEVLDRTGALNLSAALGWRDPLTNARLAALALDNGDMEIAAQRIDALGRTLGGEAAAPAADLMMTRPGGPEALAARAVNAVAGQWWLVYLRLPASRPSALGGRIDFALALERQDTARRRDLLQSVAHGLGASAMEPAERARLGKALAEAGS